jgi:dihydrofolate synthase / folylpolyglutamate synthase
MPISTYEDALRYWQTRVNYEQRGMPADLGELKLERMRLLLELLGNPQDRLRIIHIAGTKGKGSVAAMTANILRCNGCRTGLFTSPHLTRIEERIQVDGQPIGSADLTRCMQAVEQAAHTVEACGEAPPTFFEIITALGLLHFAEATTDFTVLEVGLGGRFDATNACTPLVCVITSISHDHTEQLGPTLDRIAFEKAGIIKPGVPVVSGVLAPEARAVIERIAKERHAPLTQLEKDFTFDWRPGDMVLGKKPKAVWRSRLDGTEMTDLKIGLWGQHQAQNTALALETVRVLNRQPSTQEVSAAAIAEGLRTVYWPARFEIVSRQPWIILDCAHNVASVQALIETMQGIPTTRRHLLFAASRDKDLSGMVNVLVPHFSSAVFTQYSSSSRGADPAELATLWRAAGGAAEVIAAPAAALAQARVRMAETDLLCITGSVFLAGELRPLLVVS